MLIAAMAASVSVLTCGNANAEFSFKAEAASAAFNKTAKALKLDAAFEDLGCQDGAKRVCRSSAAPVIVLSTSPSEGSNASGVMAIFVPTGDQVDGVKALTVWGVMISTIDPTLTKKEVGKMLKIFSGMVSTPSDDKRVFGNVRYGVSASPMTGVMLTGESTK
jgi:hypothetical protein